MYNERILVKTASVALSDEPAKVDAEGLEVTVRAATPTFFCLRMRTIPTMTLFPLQRAQALR